MGFLDHADDARQHRVPGRLGGLHRERSVAVDGAGVNLRALRLSTGTLSPVTGA